MNGVKNVLHEDGDSNWLVNVPYDLTGKTATCGSATMKLSEIESLSRNIAIAFYDAGLRKGIDNALGLGIRYNVQEHLHLAASIPIFYDIEIPYL